MSTRRRVAALSSIAGVGALAVICCGMVAAMLGAAAGAMIGGVLGVAAAAFVALVAGVAVHRRRGTRGSSC